MLKQSRPESCKGSFYISKASIYRLKGYILQNPALGPLMCLFWQLFTLYCNICLKFTYCPRLPFSPPWFFPLFSPSVPLSPLPTLPGEGGAGSAADVGGGAEEARGGREEAPGWDGPQAEAGGGGGEDERETLLAGQWGSGRRRRERSGGRDGGRGWETWGRGWEARHYREARCMGGSKIVREGERIERRVGSVRGTTDKNRMYT